jgi:hypothetical protein
VPADRINPDFIAEISYLKYCPRQEWYWLRNQTPEEIAVFVQYDSEASKSDSAILGESTKDSEHGMVVILIYLPTACPHAAFVNPDAPDDAEPRESIEVKIIVLNALEQRAA